MMYVTHFYDVSTNFCKQIYWYKNIGLGDIFAIELTSFDLNQAYLLDYSEYIHLLMMFALYPSLNEQPIDNSPEKVVLNV